jgi:hypothetical protein
MKSKAGVIALTIIVNSCIWGFAMIMSAHTLKGTGAYQKIQHILGGCAGGSLIVVSGGLVAKPKKPQQGE